MGVKVPTLPLMDFIVQHCPCSGFQFFQSSVEATRVLSEDFAHHNHLVVYEKAKYTVTSWLEWLASGPSPRGPGH
ncbi:hypothetical protein RJ641_004472 [Dillenia turbinata]|uniref:Uncharacterized protein n=1 Tax=Dillenia turbinata TaxID=194707 RepID=A0AAN8ZE32_9MAGN